MKLPSGSQAFLLWFAFGLMVLDHVGMLLLPGVEWLRLVGRGAFPLFAGLIAYNVAVRGVPAGKYLRRLAVFAVISQVPFGVIAGPLQLNIFVTLLLGVVVWGVAAREVAPWWLALLPLAVLVDYGVFGVALVALAAFALRGGRGSVIAGVGAVACAVAAQASLVWGLAALAWCLVLLVLVRWVELPSLPRPARWLGYGFYPAHLTVLLGLVVLLK